MSGSLPFSQMSKGVRMSEVWKHRFLSVMEQKLTKAAVCSTPALLAVGKEDVSKRDYLSTLGRSYHDPICTAVSAHCSSCSAPSSSHHQRIAGEEKLELKKSRVQEGLWWKLKLYRSTCRRSFSMVHIAAAERHIACVTCTPQNQLILLSMC